MIVVYVCDILEVFFLLLLPFYTDDHTAKEGSERIQYKCLVPIYVFPEMKLLFPKQNYNVLSLSSFTHISVRDLYISRIGLPNAYSATGKYVDRSWEYIYGIFLAVHNSLL